MHIYKRIKDLREDNDISQKKIAEYLGIRQEQYHLYESGKREIPFHLVICLAKYYKVSIDYLAGISNTKSGLSVNTLKDDELNMLKNYQILTYENKIRISERARILAEFQQNK